ncbi:hypothetical protein TCSYLVIO_006749, partial [Trypanosoma cruzi]
MESDHHLPSHTAETEDGIPRQKGMLPRRKNVAFFLHEADCGASTSACATSLATVITWLEMHRGTVRAAAVTVPQESVRTECSRPSVLQRQPAPSRRCPQTGVPQSCPPRCFLHAARGPCKAAWCPLELRPVMLRGMAAPRPRSLGSAVLRHSWDRVCALSWQQVEMLVRHTVRVAFAAILTAVRTVCARASPGDWNMDWSFTPCAPESAIRDCLPGVAPDPGSLSSAFLRRLAPSSTRCPLLALKDDQHLPRRRHPANLLGNGDTTPIRRHGRNTCCTERVSSATPAALCPARRERRNGP